jgi:DNA-binding CsgD family transcriptional regulator
LLSAATRLDAIDGGSTRDLYHRAMTAALYAGRLSAGTDIADVAAAAFASRAHRPSGIRDLRIRTMSALLIDGNATAIPMALQTIAALRSREISSPDDVELLAASAHFATVVWDDEAWVELTTRALGLARNLGCTAALPLALTGRIGAHVAQGEFPAAASLVHESNELSDATGVPIMAYPRVALAIYGPPEPAFELLRTARQAAVERGEGLAVTFCDMTEAILCNALGLYKEAWRTASSAYSDRLLYFPYLLGEVVESAARLGRLEFASGARADLSAQAAATNTDWARGIEARSEALFSDGEHAEGLYCASIEYLQRTRMRVQLARSHLLYGEWLRREGRRVDARQQLRTAHDTFDAIGAVAFTERATHELAATGETARKRTDAHENDDELTPREAQIAQLAAAGLSNREIGEQLFISHRTVGYHLAKVFAKLGVASRALIREDMLGAGTAGDTSR